MTSEWKERPRDEAVEKIEFYIAQHQLSAHTRLPGERDMCEMWGFNRTTLRSAIHRLIIEGKLYNRVGSGTFVAEPKVLRNLQRYVPFSQTVTDAGRQWRSVVLSASVIESNKQIASHLKIMLGHKIYALTRLRLMDDKPLMVDTSYLDYERFPGIESHDFSQESLYGVLDSQYGTVISKGQEQLGMTYTTAQEAELLGVPEGTAVFFVTGVAADQDGVPVEFAKVVLRSDLVRFASRLTRGGSDVPSDLSK